MPGCLCLLRPLRTCECMQVDLVGVAAVLPAPHHPPLQAWLLSQAPTKHTQCLLDPRPAPSRQLQMKLLCCPSGACCCRDCAVLWPGTKEELTVAEMSAGAQEPTAKPPPQ
jgi:hypothetical protein